MPLVEVTRNLVPSICCIRLVLRSALVMRVLKYCWDPRIESSTLPGYQQLDMSKGEILDTIKPWKGRKLRPDDIPLQMAVDSLGADRPLIRAELGQGDSRWMVSSSYFLFHHTTIWPHQKLHRVDNKKVATFVYAFVYQWSSDLETGNFFPHPEKIPNGVNTIRM